MVVLMMFSIKMGRDSLDIAWGGLVGKKYETLNHAKTSKETNLV